MTLAIESAAAAANEWKAAAHEMESLRLHSWLPRAMAGH